MDNLKELENDKLVELIKNGEVGVADIVDSGICPTCFDKENNHILYGDNSSKMIYEDELFECFLVGNPRAEGHTAISTKKHYKDMMEADEETCKKIFPRYDFEKRGSKNFVKPRFEYKENKEKLDVLRARLKN